MKCEMVLTIPVPVPHDIFSSLCEYMEEVKCKRDISAVAGAAIATWIAQARKRAAEAADSAPTGYQWKMMFLPTGTQLKTIVRGRARYAYVEGDEILHEGSSISPHGFANMFGVGGRNAWRDIWVLLPYEPIWQPAAHLRTKIRI